MKYILCDTYKLKAGSGKRTQNVTLKCKLQHGIYQLLHTYRQMLVPMWFENSLCLHQFCSPTWYPLCNGPFLLTTFSCIVRIQHSCFHSSTNRPDLDFATDTGDCILLEFFNLMVPFNG